MAARSADSTHRGERMAAILALLRDQQSVAVADLAQRFGVSQATLRRDLTLLEDQGLLVRRYGVAIATESGAEVPVAYRDRRSKAQKRAVAETAASLLSFGPQSVGFTGGSTTAEIARVLSTRVDLVVVTNALNIAMELAVKPRIRVVVSGGVARSQSTELVGPWAEAALSQATIGTAYVGVDGIDTDGITTHDIVEARTNAALIERAERVIVAADSSKIGQRYSGVMATLASVDTLVTDPGITADSAAMLSDAGVRVIVARAEKTG